MALDLCFEYFPVVLEGDEYFIFDELTSSIALKPDYGYYSTSYDDYKVEVPSEYDGHTVTKIGINRERSVQMKLMSEKDKFWLNGFEFYSASNVLEVVLPDTITEIEDYAFANCVNLRSINIPKSVKKIGKNAFASCASLGEVLVPEGAEIEENAFDVVTKVTKY